MTGLSVQQVGCFAELSGHHPSVGANLNSAAGIEAGDCRLGQTFLQFVGL